MKRHGGNENEAREIWRAYEKRFKPFIPDARFTFAMFIMDLQNAGYPLKGNQLTIEQWQWISQLKSAIQEYQIEKNKTK